MRLDERNDLSLFVEMIGGIAESQCEFSDVPDLLIKTDSGVVGIEHTRLYREQEGLPSGRQLRPQEYFHDRQFAFKTSPAHFRKLDMPSLKHSHTFVVSRKRGSAE